MELRSAEEGLIEGVGWFGSVNPGAALGSTEADGNGTVVRGPEVEMGLAVVGPVGSKVESVKSWSVSKLDVAAAMVGDGCALVEEGDFLKNSVFKVVRGSSVVSIIPLADELSTDSVEVDCPTVVSLGKREDTLSLMGIVELVMISLEAVCRLV